MKISSKLTLGYLAMALFVGVVGYLGINVTNTIDNAFEKVAEETLPIIEALQDLRFAGLSIVSSTNEFEFIATEKIERPLEEKRLIAVGNDRFNYAFKQYEDLVNKFFPEEEDFLACIRQVYAKKQYIVE